MWSLKTTILMSRIRCCTQSNSCMVFTDNTPKAPTGVWWSNKVQARTMGRACTNWLSRYQSPSSALEKLCHSAWARPHQHIRSSIDRCFFMTLLSPIAGIGSTVVQPIAHLVQCAMGFWFGSDRSTSRFHWLVLARRSKAWFAPLPRVLKVLAGAITALRNQAVHATPQCRPRRDAVNRWTPLSLPRPWPNGR